MTTGPTKNELTESRRRLIEVMQSLNFGRIEGLIIRGGDPVLEPMPRLIREHKFAGENGARPELGVRDFLLKAQYVDLFQVFDEIQDGTIAVMTVKSGLPFLADLPC